MIAPYDTELYGHWWFEGIEWIKRVLRLMEIEGVRSTTISDFLRDYEGHRYEIELPEGSWGMYGTTTRGGTPKWNGCGSTST